MADKWPLANGNWSNAANWNDGTKPQSGDNVYADGKTVTIDENVTVLSIRTTQRSGGTNGGQFNLNAGLTVSATSAGFIGGGGICINFTSSGSPSVLNGSCESQSTFATVYNNTSLNTLTINGNVINGQGGATATVSCNNNGTTIINGTVSGSLYANGLGVITSGNSSCILNIFGNVTGGAGTAAYGMRIDGSTQVTITGNVSGGSANNAHGIFSNGSTVIIINGNVTGGTGTNYGISRTTATSITVNGNVTGGGLTTTNSIGILLGSNNSPVTINGNVVAGTGSGGGCVGISCNAPTSATVITVSGNIEAVGSVTAISGASPTIQHTSGQLKYSSTGTQPFITSGIYTVHATNAMTISTRVTSTLVERLFYTLNAAPSSVTPLASDVRSGISYANGERTGTCAVPPAASVALGVPVDNTVGTAIITESILASALQSALSPNAPVAVQRTVDDTKAITFSWPVSGATITGQKSVDNGAYSAVSGAIAFLRTESNRHYYTLAYNAADRLDVEGTIRYKLTDGTYTKYVNLHVYDVTSDVTVYPTQLQQEDRAVEAPIKLYTNESGEQYFFAIDANKDPINLMGKNLELRFADSSTKKVLYVAKTADASLSVDLTNKVTFTKSLDFTRYEMSMLRFSLRDMAAGQEVLLAGPVKLVWAP